jgi:hypothetical protein
MLDKIFENPPLSISVFICLVGLSLTVLALYYLVKANESLKWEQTEGKVLTSDVVKNSYRSSGGGYSTTYKAEICYSYIINQERFIADKINVFFNFSSTFSIRANRLVAKYPKDSKTTVYYDPNNPNDCVLEPGIKSEMVVFMLIGLLIATIAFAYALSHGLFEGLGQP